MEDEIRKVGMIIIISIFTVFVLTMVAIEEKFNDLEIKIEKLDK